MQVPMFNARKLIPLLSAFAGGTDSCVGGWILGKFPLAAVPDLAHVTVPFPICRGGMR